MATLVQPKQPTPPPMGGAKMSILSTAKPATDIDKETYKIKAMLAGASGSGKTQSASTLPGKLLFIDYDGRSETLAGLPNVDIVDCYDADPKSPKAWMKAEEIRKEIWSQIRTKSFPYDGIVEDGLTQMLRYCMNWSLLLDPKRGLGGAPAKQHYLPQMKNVGDHVLSLKSLPLHYLLTVHLEIIEDEELGGLKYLPKATGKMRTEIPSWFNECYFCLRHPDDKGKLRYYWNTSGNGRWEFLKSTINQLGKYWKDPVEIDFSKELVGFKDLLDRRFPQKTEN